MKLSTLSTKLTCGKTKVLGVIGGLAFAGAALAFATPAASAQQFGVAVQFGGPRYVVPAPVYSSGYYGGGYYQGYTYAPRYAYARPDWDDRRGGEWREHQEWREHEEHEHHDFDGRRGYHGDRDR